MDDSSRMVGVEDPKIGGEEVESGGQHHHVPTTNCRGITFFFKTAMAKVTLILMVVLTVWLIINQSLYPRIQLFPSGFYNNLISWKNCGNNLSSTLYPENVEMLKNTLNKAAMADGKTVIITTLNAAWTAPNTIFDLFLESFRIGNQTQNLLRHVVVAALDQTAYARCLDAHLHCYHLITPGVNFTGEAYFMTDDYLQMMWRRIDFLRIVLELGFNFVFTTCCGCGIHLTDFTPTGNSKPPATITGLTQRTERIHPTEASTTSNPAIGPLNSTNSWVRELGMEMRFLDTAYYGGFCEPSKDLDLVVTMHANCCVGIENKIHDMSLAIDDWKRYMAAAVADGGVVTNSSLRSWTMPRRCG